MLVPQAKEPAALIANPPPGAFNRLMGSCGVMIWGHGGCCHGKNGAKLLGVGGRLLILFFCAVWEPKTPENAPSHHKMLLLYVDLYLL
jgi:hypothetical protein